MFWVMVIGGLEVHGLIGVCVDTHDKMVHHNPVQI